MGRQARTHEQRCVHRNSTQIPSSSAGSFLLLHLPLYPLATLPPPKQHHHRPCSRSPTSSVALPGRRAARRHRGRPPASCARQPGRRTPSCCASPAARVRALPGTGRKGCSAGHLGTRVAAGGPTAGNPPCRYNGGACAIQMRRWALATAARADADWLPRAALRHGCCVCACLCRGRADTGVADAPGGPLHGGVQAVSAKGLRFGCFWRAFALGGFGVREENCGTDCKRMYCGLQPCACFVRGGCVVCASGCRLAKGPRRQAATAAAPASSPTERVGTSATTILFFALPPRRTHASYA